jgi:hypothetical protein
MIRMLISIALNRDLQGDPVYIRCARCGTTSDVPTRTLSVTTYHPGRPIEHMDGPPRLGHRHLPPLRDQPARRTCQRLGLAGRSNPRAGRYGAAAPYQSAMSAW